MSLRSGERCLPLINQISLTSDPATIPKGGEGLSNGGGEEEGKNSLAYNRGDK